METIRKNRIWGIIILVILVIMVTVKQFSGTASESASVAADSEKIGISVTNGDTFFICYADIKEAELVTGQLTELLVTDDTAPDYAAADDMESENTEDQKKQEMESRILEDHLWYGTFAAQDGTSWLVCADPTIGSWIRITTSEENYLINSSSKKATEKIFDQIQTR